MGELFKIIETHPVSVNIIIFILAVIGAWFSGIFNFIKRKTNKPDLRLQDTASTVYYEEHEKYKEYQNAVNASFFINASVINRTDHKIVIDNFFLAYKCLNKNRSFKQKIHRIAFPSPPQKQLGDTIILHPVFITQYPETVIALPPTSQIVEPYEINGGHLLFISFTHGKWNPVIIDGKIEVELIVTLTDGLILKDRKKIRVHQNSKHADNFCKGIVEFMRDDTTWNHEEQFYR